MSCEVLAPGGSLDHALWALEGGANAVYVGFRQFSARSHADNLSLEDMAVLTAVAHSKQAKVFVAVNTILRTAEIAEAVGLCWNLHYAGVDALIVQDLGLARALKEFGPPLDLHASTQAAVHNPGGAAALKAMGFRRVILAREMTMAEIRAIVKADPTLEYEVFVHGALCYAVSGNCMASGLMIGRSANRGDCGQICRTKFELDYLIPGPSRKDSPHEEGLPNGIHAPAGETTWNVGSVGAFASMNDLELGARIRELREAGVTSFKIEGRMKPPAYSYNTARAYQAFLAGGQDEEAWSWLDEARLRYGRLPSAGWFDGHKALAQTNPEWAGTLGMPLGSVISGQDKTVGVVPDAKREIYRSLAKGDGVMILGPIAGQVFRGALAGPTQFSQTTIQFDLAERPGFDVRGGTLWLVSRHDGKLPVKRGGKPWRHRVDQTVMWRYQADSHSLEFVLRCSAFPQLCWTESLPAESATGSKSLDQSLREVLEASDSRFGLGKLDVDADGLNWFVQPRLLKELRRHWYAAIEAAADAQLSELPQRVLLAGHGFALPPPNAGIPSRSELSPLQGVNGLTGFVTEWERLKSQDLADTPWGRALPLPPFVPNERQAYERLRAVVERAGNEGWTVFPGLSNPCHLTWIHRLRSEGLPIPHWFADWGFHRANPWTEKQLFEALGGLVFTVPWLEDPEIADTTYFPPLFTSRACMLRNSFGAGAGTSAAPTKDAQFDSRAWLKARLDGKWGERPEQGPRCPAGCSGHFSARLVQGKKSFRVEARDCINYLLAEDGVPDRG